jgi:hypothetical protein
MNLLSHRNVHRITCHPVAAENRHCREFLHLLKEPTAAPVSHKPTAGGPQSPSAVQGFEGLNGKLLETVGRSTPLFAVGPTRQLPASLDPPFSLVGKNEGPRGAWWALPSKETTSSGQALVLFIYTPPPDLLAAPHS